MHWNITTWLCVRYILITYINSTYHTFSLAGDPSNYLTYFKRATVYLALGQSKKALPDLSKVVELKPDFHQVIIYEYRYNYY